MMQEILSFLSELDQNNNSAWFQLHKPRYQQARACFEQLGDRVLNGLSESLPAFSFVKAKDCIFRINRDVRFSQNKLPYKNNFGAYFAEGGRKSERQGFYLHIQPNNQSFLGGGAYENSPQMLYKLRQEISYEPEKFWAVFNEPTFKATFPELLGQRLKTAPKGYAKDHPQIELLRHNQLYVAHRLSDAELLQPDLVDRLLGYCHILKPFLDLLDEAFLH